MARQLAPIAWPIAKLLDYVLGVHGAHTYKKAELKSFLQFHRTGEEPLRDDEISILNGVLELNTKNVEQIMTPIQACFCFYILSARATTDHWRRTLSHLARMPSWIRRLLILCKLIFVLLSSPLANTGFTPSLSSGYSRFPVHRPGQPFSYAGLLLIKKVIIVCLIQVNN